MVKNQHEKAAKNPFRGFFVMVEHRVMTEEGHVEEKQFICHFCCRLMGVSKALLCSSDHCTSIGSIWHHRKDWRQRARSHILGRAAGENLDFHIFHTIQQQWALTHSSFCHFIHLRTMPALSKALIYFHDLIQLCLHRHWKCAGFILVTKPLSSVISCSYCVIVTLYSPNFNLKWKRTKTFHTFFCWSS